MTEEDDLLVRCVESLPMGTIISSSLFRRYKEIITRRSKMEVANFNRGSQLSPKGGKKGKPKPKGGGKGC